MTNWLMHTTAAQQRILFPPAFTNALEVQTDIAI